jgi:hypothetical protein
LATPEFIGRWGGHLYLLSKAGAFEPQPSSPASLDFGERGDGMVFVRAGIWGRSSDGRTNATAQVVSRNRIRIHVEHSVADGSRVLNVIQKYSLIFKKKGILDCIESVQIYDRSGASVGPPYDSPMLSAIYHGALLSISDEEADKLQTELVSNGYIPEAKVEGQSSFGSHD